MKQLQSILTDLDNKAITKHQAYDLILVLFDVSNRREQLIAFAQWLAHEEEYGKEGSIGTVDAYLESN